MKKSLLAVVLLCFAVKSFGTTHSVANVGSTFSPDSITITQGDTVLFTLQGTHNATEVDQATWLINDNTPLGGGFSIPFGGGTVTGLSIGTHYYVCDNHFGSGMKGRIVVQAAPANPSVEFVLTSSTQVEGVGTFGLALSITNANANATTVDINVLGGGTATFGTDFTFSPLTVTFPANSTFTQNVTVTLADDVIAESNETFTFQLNFPTNNATIGSNAQHTVTIIDNDLLKFDITPASQTVNENAGIITFPVSLNSVSTNSTSVTVHLETIGTTATQGVDFTFNDTTLVWPAGSLGPILVPVTILDDAVYEQHKTIKFRLINPTNGAGFLNDNFVLTVQNNDPRTTGDCTDLFFSEYIEGNNGTMALEIFNPTSSTVDLSEYRIYKSNDGGTSWWTFDLTGTLAPGDVYVGANPNSIPPIQLAADTLDVFFDFSGNDAPVLIHWDDTIDIIGQVGINPGNSWPLTGGSTQDHTLIRSYYTYEGTTDWSIAQDSWRVYPNGMADSLGVHQIAPCGTPEPIIPSYIHFTLLNDTVLESTTATIPVVVQIDNPNAVRVSYLLVRNDNAGTASAGADYNFPNRSFSTNAPGTTFDTVYLTVLEDQLIEPLEDAVLHFINLGRGTTVIQDSTFTVHIIDNDTLTASYFGAGFSYIEKDTVVGVKVFLSTFPTDTVRVNVTLTSGNATNGVDFTFTDTVLVFLPNSTDTLSALIHVLDDNWMELNEQINLNLTDTVGVRIAISAYTLTIIDNDSTVGISQVEWENSVKMFPNPVLNTLTIQTENEWLHADITDLLGNVVMHLEKLSLGRNSIDVSLLRAGMYFVNMRNEQKVFSRRFVRQD